MAVELTADTYGSRLVRVAKLFHEEATTATSFQIIRIPKEWEERGEMTIRTISKQPIGPQ